jgi:UDP-N-acetylglucosamine:LPS N-acetylglucosamine transferase
VFSAGGGGGHTTMNFAITAPVDQRTQAQIAAAAELGMMRGRRNQ